MRLAFHRNLGPIDRLARISLGLALVIIAYRRC